MAVVFGGMAASAFPAEAATNKFGFNGVRTDGDRLNLFVTTDDALVTQSFLKHVNPVNGLTSPAYTFTGYTIIDVSGSIYDAKDNAIYEVIGFSPVGSIVENSVNNTPPGPDTIAHSPTDNLYNPGFEPATPFGPFFDQGGAVSPGGFAVTVNAGGTPEVYQLYTDPLSGKYAGCPGSCAITTRVPAPGPLPLLGVAAGFGYSRNLRKRIKGSESIEMKGDIG